MLPSVTVEDELREAILKPPTVEDVHMYPLLEICSMTGINTSNDREIELALRETTYSVVVVVVVAINTDKVDVNGPHV